MEDIVRPQITNPAILPPGSLINNRYLVQECLAIGEVATVYRCLDRKHPRTSVVAKLLHGRLLSDSKVSARFAREIECTRKINHPNVARVMDVISNAASVGFVMEYIRGINLCTLVESDRLSSIDAIINITSQICSGVAAINSAGIVHRDLKPENMLLTKDGVVKIIDFGIASELGKKLTQPGSILGTIYYMSPEYVAHGQLDERSDIYSIGVICYELITKKPPFDGMSFIAVMEHKVLRDPPAPHTINAACPNELSNIVLRAIERDPNRRYQKAEHLRADLLCCQGRLAMRQESPHPPRPAVFQKTRPALPAKSKIAPALLSARQWIGSIKPSAVFKERLLFAAQSAAALALVTIGAAYIIRGHSTTALTGNAARDKQIALAASPLAPPNPDLKSSAGTDSAAASSEPAAAAHPSSTRSEPRSQTKRQNAPEIMKTDAAANDPPLKKQKTPSEAAQQPKEPQSSSPAKMQHAAREPAPAKAPNRPQIIQTTAKSAATPPLEKPPTQAGQSALQDNDVKTETPPSAATPQEYASKAALLLRLNSYVKPLNARTAGGGTATCVVGTHSFGSSLTQAAAAKGANVRYLPANASPQSMQACKTAFFPAGAQITPELNAELKKLNVLTVTEEKGNGMVDLSLANQTVHVKINHLAAGEAGLKLTPE